MTTAVLATHGLTVRYGGVHAVDGVDLQIGAGSVAGLIGPNGAGKTTFVDAVTGFTAASTGCIELAGDDVSGWPPHRLARAGLARTFQSLELFDDLTVRENLVVASSTPSPLSTMTDFLWRKSGDEPGVDDALDTVGIGSLSERLPGELSNGERHRVALARALVGRPRLVLLDEPAAGLGPAETDELAELIRRLPALGTSVLLIDHDMSLVMGVCDEVHVLDLGRLIASGPAATVRTDPLVIAAYLGSES